LKKHFLAFLQYNLSITFQEYLKYYYVLQGFAQNNKLSFELDAKFINDHIDLKNNRKENAKQLNKSF